MYIFFTLLSPLKLIIYTPDCPRKRPSKTIAPFLRSISFSRDISAKISKRRESRAKVPLRIVGRIFKIELRSNGGAERNGKSPRAFPVARFADICARTRSRRVFGHARGFEVFSKQREIRRVGAQSQLSRIELKVRAFHSHSNYYVYAFPLSVARKFAQVAAAPFPVPF